MENKLEDCEQCGDAPQEEGCVIYKVPEHRWNLLADTGNFRGLADRLLVCAECYMAILDGSEADAYTAVRADGEADVIAESAQDCAEDAWYEAVPADRTGWRTWSMTGVDVDSIRVDLGRSLEDFEVADARDAWSKALAKLAKDAGF